MCVIVVKPAFELFPSYSELEACWSTNPDGAGFMYPEGNKIRIKKGFMDFDEFMDALNQHIADKGVDLPAVMHFRIATHGEVSRECSHPFPLSDDLKHLRELDTLTNVGVAHNGIIQGRDTNSKKSDTMDFVMNFVHHIYKSVPAFTKDKGLCSVIEQSINGSRMVFLEPNGKLTFLGHWEMKDGCMYSNLNHEWSTFRFQDHKTSASAGDYSVYGYDDYGYSRIKSDDKRSIEFPSELCELCPCREDCLDYDYRWCADETEVVKFIETCEKGYAFEYEEDGGEEHEWSRHYEL